MRRLRRRLPCATGVWRLGRGLAAGSAIVGVVFLFALLVTLIGGGGEFLFGVPLSFGLLLVVPILILAATAGALACTVLGWCGSGAGGRLPDPPVFVLVGIVALAWFLWQWNLIGWLY